jgi:hypothetical protein
MRSKLRADCHNDQQSSDQLTQADRGQARRAVGRFAPAESDPATFPADRGSAEALTATLASAVSQILLRGCGRRWRAVLARAGLADPGKRLQAFLRPLRDAPIKAGPAAATSASVDRVSSSLERALSILLR